MSDFPSLFAFRTVALLAFFSVFCLLWLRKRRGGSLSCAFEALTLWAAAALFGTLHGVLKGTRSALRNAAGAVVSVCDIISVFPRAFHRALENPALGIHDTTQNSAAAALLLGVGSFLAAALVAVCLKTPGPMTHDEFSYLLASDTFVHRRLANPPHPHWRHFESFHIIQQPSYASKYPPAQGLFLALGQIPTGRPIAGVWLSFALMAGALCWMLGAFFPLAWAFLGALLVVFRVGFIGQPDLVKGFGYWSQSYWGGAVAALGGILVIGSLRRLWDRPSVLLSSLFGVGLALLANSRPYEGALIGLPSLGALLFWLLKDKRFPQGAKVIRVVLPLCALLALTASWMAYYNWRVTGNPLKTPYQLHEETYGMPPLFLGQVPRPKTDLPGAVLKSYYNGYVQRLYAVHSPIGGFIKLTLSKLKAVFSFYFGFLLLVPLFFIGKTDFLRDPWTKFAGFVLLFSALGLLPVERLLLPHYAAPLTGLFAFFLAKGLMRLSEWRWRSLPLGGAALFALAALCLAEIAVPARHKDPLSSTFDEDRARLSAQLQALEGRHLVLVRYAPHHRFHDEWVYNGADIDNSKIIWARELSPSENARLTRYFRDRTVWLLEADKKPARLARSR